MKTDFLTEKTTKYPAVFLDDNGGTISTSGQAVLAWRLFIFDLVNIADHTKLNDNDVASDVISIAMDLIAQLNRNENRWVISTDNAIQLLVEEDSDMPDGVVIDFSIRFPYEQNICQIPTTYSGYSPIDSGGTPTPWGVLAHVDNEVPVGAIDGVNKVFTLANNFLDKKYVQLYIDGVRQTPTTHFVASGTKTITLSDAMGAGETILVDYISTS